MRIRANPSRAAAVALLERERLPTADLSERSLDGFFFSGPDDAPTALVGLEIVDKVALLRSLVVDAGERLGGVGTRLVAHAEEHARALGVAPDGIRSTTEFASLCPASSALMFKPLTPKGDL